MGFKPPRGGFTVVEVLIALFVLMVATTGIVGLVATTVSRANVPVLTEQASFLATERLDYFRNSTNQGNIDGGTLNGFAAAGGSYYPPPGNPTAPDLDLDPAYHNVAYNRIPTLFAREYLYEQTESRSASVAQNLGQRNQQRNLVAGTRTARNEVGPTPLKLPAPLSGAVALVVPNDESAATPVAPLALPNGTYAIPMERANDALRGTGFDMSDPSLRFVREVWVQLNHPGFPAIGLPPGNIPAFLAAPPYTAVVTVRVYLKEPVIRTYDPVTQISTGQGVGYLSNKAPLAEVAGYFVVPGS